MLDLDLILAILHHTLVFALFAVLLTELTMVRRGIDASAIKRVQSVDLWYGAFAALVIVVGFSRAIFAAKGWEYYSHNAFFWARVAECLR